MQRVTPKAYDALQKFGRWIVELNDPKFTFRS